ncbi:hypothetical protein ACHQM5_012407 [Ranunculus cassubicifolius]
MREYEPLRFHCLCWNSKVVLSKPILSAMLLCKIVRHWELQGQLRDPGLPNQVDFVLPALLCRSFYRFQ